MIRQTGGSESGATSTKSNSLPCALSMASSRGIMPSCLPDSSIRRTSSAVIFLLVRMFVLMVKPLHLLFPSIGSSRRFRDVSSKTTNRDRTKSSRRGCSCSVVTENAHPPPHLLRQLLLNEGPGNYISSRTTRHTSRLPGRPLGVRKREAFCLYVILSFKLPLATKDQLGRRGSPTCHGISSTTTAVSTYTEQRRICQSE